MIIVVSSFSPSSVLKMISEARPVFSNSFGLKNLFEKLRFRDESLLSVGLTVA